ncbi:MAG: hypothetical protein GX879_06850 [Bacteroidales bacterium]|nr:hypothetical protein [Bacteroidales bacterium]
MKRLLEQVVEFVLDNYSDNLGQLCMVFPNNRPALYFRKYFAERISKPTWAPAMITISELFTQKSKLQEADELVALADLFKHFKTISKSNESFDNFYSWGKIMLSDFDDVDTYLADAEKVFANIKDLKEIDAKFSSIDQIDIDLIREYWGNILIPFENRENTDNELQRFIELWQILYDLYKANRESLKKLSLGTKGMIARDIAENLSVFEKDDTIYCFAGFNILNNSEKTLMKFLQKQQKAVFLWDYDEFYMSKKTHEAGHFLAQNIKEFPQAENFETLTQGISKENLKINCVAAPSDVAQVKYAGRLLENFPDNSDTALILGNEDLLPLVLHSLPEKIGDYNISMGLNVRHSDAVSWLRLILTMHSKHRKIDNQNYYYHKYVIALLKHPLSLKLDKNSEILAESLLKQQQAYIAESQLTEQEKISEIFKYPSGGVESFIEYFCKLINLLLNIETDDETYWWSLNSEILFSIYKDVFRLQNIIKTQQIQFEDFKLFSHLIDQILRSKIVPFEGEPLVGMQVLGLLETRLLDFKNIVILSLNEGVLPKATTAPSFIPMNLRYAYNLPTNKHIDSLYAYYFYRLLHQAENVHLVYKMATKDVGGGEKSRFIYQLQFELTEKIQFSQIAYDVSVSRVNAVSVEKDEKILNFLSDFIAGKVKRNLSASSLNKYIKCPLSFYFDVVAGIKESASIDDDADAQRIGDVFHKVIQELYQEFSLKKQEITKEDIIKIINNDKKISDVLIKKSNDIFSTKFTKIEEFSGKHRVYFEVIKAYLIELLKKDEELLAPFYIYGLEEEIRHEKTLNINNSSIKLFIKGYIDRLDEKDGLIRILDYKTGKVNRNFASIEQLFEIGRNYEYDNIFQLLLYSYMIDEKSEYKAVLQPALLSVTELHADDFSTNLSFNRKPIDNINIEIEDKLMPEPNKGKVLDLFEAKLHQLISDILNPNISFSQTDDKKNCTYCLFKDICGIA